MFEQKFIFSVFKDKNTNYFSCSQNENHLRQTIGIYTLMCGFECRWARTRHNKYIKTRDTSNRKNFYRKYTFFFQYMSSPYVSFTPYIIIKNLKIVKIYIRETSGGAVTTTAAVGGKYEYPHNLGFCVQKNISNDLNMKKKIKKQWCEWIEIIVM